jgi:hypothetical protein
MHLGVKRQGQPPPPPPDGLPPRVEPPTVTPAAATGDGLSHTIVVTSTVFSTQFNTDGQPQDTWPVNVVRSTQVVPGPSPAITSATAPMTTTVTTAFQSSPIPVPATTQTAAPAQTSAAAAKGVPLSTLIPAIVVPVVVVALLAPIALYFCLTRHDRQQRSKSQMSSTAVSSRGYPESRAEVKSPNYRHFSSETDGSKASDIMNFNLGSAVEKPLPVVNVRRLPPNALERPDMFERPIPNAAPERTETFEVHRGLESPIGQAISDYSDPSQTSARVIESQASGRAAEDPAQNRMSIQELTEENMRIAQLVNDSNASFGVQEEDEVSDISATERHSRSIGRRATDQLSDVSSIYEDDGPAMPDHGGGLFGNHEARRSGHLH